MCYHGVNERVRPQKPKRLGIFADQEVPKTFFGLRRPRLLHNLGAGLWSENRQNGYILMKKLLFMIMELLEKVYSLKKPKNQKKKNKRDNDPPDAIYPMW